MGSRIADDPHHPERIELTLDGEPVSARRGEPVAASLLAADKTTIARSPKFHRPRGPSCMRGACDGCLARVNDVPNVMTCLVPAEGGMAVVSQNRLGPREADFLRVTDWFFPDGMNHHELFAGVPGVQAIMQGFARRVAGLGKLPAEGEQVRPASRREVDVVVVGAGPSGMVVAVELASSGRVVEVIDDKLRPGGGITALGARERASFAPLELAFEALVQSRKIRLRSRTTAGAIYGGDLLVAGEDGAEIVEARDLVLACGAHDGALAFEGNDVPNVMSARAAGWLLSYGVLVGDAIAIVIPEGGGPFGESLAHELKKTRARVSVLHGDPIAIRGANLAKGVKVHLTDTKKDVSVDADAVIIDAPRAPAFELAEQAGAELAHEPRGFVVEAHDGLIRRSPTGERVWAVGELVGVPFEASALRANAEAVSKRILER